MKQLASIKDKYFQPSFVRGGPAEVRAANVEPGALPARRHFELLQLLDAHRQMTVNELAGRLQVSCETVRRDLKVLAARGLLGRTYGGAVARQMQVHLDTGVAQGRSAPQPAEMGIARSAARLIQEGETLVVSGCFLTRLCARHLRQNQLTVITNDLSLPSTLPAAYEVHVLGGQYKRDIQATVGPVSVVGLGITADSALIGVGGLTPNEGMSVAGLAEAFVSSAAIACARRTIVLAESSALGRNAFARIGPLARAQVLVTDQMPPVDLAKALRSVRVDVVVAPSQ